MTYAKKRVALVGCGAISGNHLKGILSAGEEPCALCDIDISRAEAAREKYAPDAEVFSDYIAMLEQIRPDVVHICTPHDLHAPMCEAALVRGIHVLCEKPLCISLEQLESITQVVKASTATLGVCHQNRYEPNMLRLKELTEGGVRAATGIVTWCRDAAYYNSAAWRGTWAHEGGGVMINQALHTLDLMQWMCGFPHTVVAHIATDARGDAMETEDTAMARFADKTGGVFHFFATVAANADMPVLLRMKLSDGRNVEAGNSFLVIDGVSEPLPLQRQTEGKSVWGAGHARLIADFYDCLATGRHFPIDLDEGARVVRLILAMYRSGGTRVEIL